MKETFNFCSFICWYAIVKGISMLTPWTFLVERLWKIHCFWILPAYISSLFIRSIFTSLRTCLLLLKGKKRSCEQRASRYNLAPRITVSVLILQKKKCLGIRMSSAIKVSNKNATAIIPTRSKYLKCSIMEMKLYTCFFQAEQSSRPA